MTINLGKIILLWGFVLLLTAIACARPNPKICRNKSGKFPRPGTSCRGYYECRNYVPVEKTCGDGENFNANKGRCDWEDLYPCLEKQKDKECLRENGLFLKPGTNCKKYYRCCNGKAKVESCSGDLLFDPSKEKCEWPDLYTCIESLSTTEKISSTVTMLATSTPPPKTSTDPAISKSTIQKTTASNRIIYSTHNPDTSTKLNTQTTPTDGQSTFQTSETSTISQTITSKTSTSRPTAEISTSLEPKEISTTSEVPTSQSTITEISTLQPTTTEISTLQSTTAEISTMQPTTTEISTSQSTTAEISTLQPTTTEISTSQPTTTEISTSQSTITEISTLQPTTTEISTSQLTTTEISTSQSTITEISTLQPTTTEISTSQPISESSTLRPTTSDISVISQTTSPQMSSTHSTDHTILKENKEGESTEPTIFETTIEVTFSPSTVEVTTSAEVNIMCPEPNGYFPHPTDKHKFVGCVGNIPNVLTCPSNLVYKHRLRRCDHE